MTGGVNLLDSNLEVLELRQILGNRCQDIELALFGQHHRRHAHDRFGHRGDAEDGVGPHGKLLFAVAVTEGAKISHLALALDQHDGAGNLAGIDIALEGLRHPL